MKKLLEAIAVRVVDLILNEDKIDAFVDKVVEAIVARLENEFGDQ